MWDSLQCWILYCIAQCTAFKKKLQPPVLDIVLHCTVHCIQEAPASSVGYCIALHSALHSRSSLQYWILHCTAFKKKLQPPVWDIVLHCTVQHSRRSSSLQCWILYCIAQCTAFKKLQPPVWDIVLHCTVHCI